MKTITLPELLEKMALIGASKDSRIGMSSRELWECKAISNGRFSGQRVGGAFRQQRIIVCCTAKKPTAENVRVVARMFRY